MNERMRKVFWKNEMHANRPFCFSKRLASLGKGEIALLKMQPPNNNNNNNNNTLQKFLTSF
jgi:hypothetical protein